MGWGDWAQVAVSAYGAYSGKKGAKDAGKPAQQAALASNDLTKWMYEQDLKRQQPFYNTGVAADARLSQLLGLGGGSGGSNSNPQQSQQTAFDAFRNTPGYQFGLDEGRKTLEASAAAAGGLNSGATLRALTRYGQGYADQQGYRPYVSDLMQLSGHGQAQASSMGAQGMQYANQMGANLQNAADARARSTYQQNQNVQQGLGALSGWLGYMGGNRNTGSNQRVTGADTFGYGYGW